MENLYTDECTSMAHMFYNCSSLTSLDISGWNTSNVTDTSYVFYGCSSFTNLDISKWSTSGVTNMDWMFAKCQLTKIKVSQETYDKMTELAKEKNETVKDYLNFYKEIIVDKK